ncbi:MAG: dihydrofolate reductase, partial [Bacteroidota bacterium]
HPVIMGRKNYESIPAKYRPLPNRKNIVITRQPDYKAEGAFVVNSLEEAIASADNENPDEIFIIGGGQIYEMGLKVADIMYITEIHHEFDGDAYFPEYDKSVWKEEERVPHTRDERHAYPFDFVTYLKKS